MTQINPTQDNPAPAPTDFLTHGGAMAVHIAAFDWRETLLGVLESWPNSLKCTLATVLGSPKPMYVLWGQELFFFFNDAYAPMLGKHLEGAMGRPFAQVWPELWLDFEPMLREALAGRGSSHENAPLTLTRYGHAEPTWWTFSFLSLRDERGLVVGVHCICSETTELVRAQAQAEFDLRQTQTVLDLRTTELLRSQNALKQSQKLEALGQLTGGVAHDFNNLLAVISASVELLRKSELPVLSQGQYLDRIFNTVGRATKLTGQLLAFARQQPLTPEVFDVDQQVQIVLDLVRPLMGRQVEIVHQFVVERTCFARADINQFETALVNLAVNARDAMDAKGRLTVDVRAVDGVPAGLARAVQPGAFIAISVSDTGCGIAPDKLDAIFEPFYTTKGVGKGTGLGLSQVFGFAKQSGGEIEVTSTLGQGSIFTLYLARADSLPIPCISTPKLDEPPQEPALASSVLVVEDNEMLAEMACEILHALGYRAVWAANATAALGLLARQPDDFDLVFSDVAMPGMNGVEFGKEVRLRHPGLPVVLTSGSSAVTHHKEQCSFEMILKPYTSEALVRAFRKAIAQQS